MKSNPGFVKPIVQFFLQLTNGTEEPDTATLDKAIHALEDLKKYYNEGLEALTKTYNEERDEHSALLTQLTNQITTLTTILIPKTEQE